MSRNETRFTVLFQPPFWVGIAERWEEGRYQAARIPFGGEPTDAQILQWLERGWGQLRFSSPAADGEPAVVHRNPKRLQREARRAAAQEGIGTRAQQALSRQREQEGEDRRARSRRERQRAEEEQFLLRRQKKREKRRGR